MGVGFTPICNDGKLTRREYLCEFVRSGIREHFSSRNLHGACAIGSAQCIGNNAIRVKYCFSHKFYILDQCIWDHLASIRHQRRNVKKHPVCNENIVSIPRDYQHIDPCICGSTRNAREL